MFLVTLSNVLIALLYVVPGYVLCKAKKMNIEHSKGISQILIYLCSPVLVVSNFLKLDFSVDLLISMGWFFLVTLILQAVFMGIIYLICCVKNGGSDKGRLLTIATVLGNVGFFGVPIVSALYPEAPIVACYASMYSLSMNMIAFTVGVFCLTKDKKSMNLINAFFNPNNVGFWIALPIFIFGLKAYIPQVLISAINLIASMSMPLCMIILGVRLATFPIKDLVTDWFVYLDCFLKLLVFPLFCYFAVYFLPFSVEFKGCVLILSGTPCASIMFSLSEIHDRSATLSAKCLLMTTILCVLTMPILALFL